VPGWCTPPWTFIAGEIEPHFAVGILEVRGDGSRAQVDPLSDDAVSHEAVVTLVGVSQHDGGGHLAVDPATGSDRGMPNRSA
jgi:hypothetical protein